MGSIPTSSTMYYTREFRYREDLMDAVNAISDSAELVTVFTSVYHCVLYWYAIVRQTYPFRTTELEKQGWKLQ